MRTATPDRIDLNRVWDRIDYVRFDGDHSNKARPSFVTPNDLVD